MHSSRLIWERVAVSIDSSANSSVGLDVTGLTVAYNGVPAVRGIDIAVAGGEAVGLIGPNGAGKSSSLLAIMGATARTGSVRINGQDASGLVPEKVVRLGIALVPEGRHVFAGQDHGFVPHPA